MFWGCCILFLLLLQPLHAQFYALPNHWLFQQTQDYYILHSDTNLSTTTYPYTPFIFMNFPAKDTVGRVFKYIKDDPALDIIFEKDLVFIQQKDFKVRINPLLNFQKGKQTIDTTISAYTNTRGFIASLQFEKVYIETMLSENQSVFPDYLYNYSKTTQVVPGQGRWKNFKQSGFDYAFSAGLVSIQVHKNTYISFGTGKQKIGNGYRSLLLSDNAFVYPFVKIEKYWWKGRLQYICNYAILNNLSSASIKHPANTERLFQRKPYVYQYLNVGIFKHTRIGFFQGIIAEQADKKNVWRGDGIVYSPIIFSQYLYYGLNNKNNVLVGADIQQKLLNSIMFYGQIVYDSDNKNPFKHSYGYQIGLKWLEKIKDWRMMFLSEWNNVTDNTYSSLIIDNFTNSSYSHFNQNLAYTPDSGKELIVLLSLKRRRWLCSGQWNYQGKNNITYNINYFKGMVGFIINPAYNLILNAGVENRRADKNSNYIYLQLQTGLYNVYYDF